MKVLFLSDFFLSGQTTHVLELAKQLRALGIDVHIAFGTIHTRLFRTHYKPYLRRENIPFSEGADLTALGTLNRKFKPELIHSQSSTLFQRAQLLSSRLGIPYILTCHGLGFNQARYRYLLMDASAVIAIGPNVAREIEHLNSKTIVIANGVDVDYFVPPASDKKPRKEIVYIGRLERKRIEALKQLAKAHQQVAKGPLRIISNWDPGIPGAIFKPWQADLAPHFQQAGIVAACGRTAREAMSSGNAVCLMQQSYDGIISPALVTREDFDFSGNLDRFPLERLQRDLQQLVRSSYRLKRLQSWSRSYALAHLSSEQMAKKTLALYQSIKAI